MKPIVLFVVALALAVGCQNTSGRPSAPSLGPLVTVSMRQSHLFGSSAVLQISNVSSGTLSGITIRFRNLDNNQSGAYNLPPLPRGEMAEVGVLECGWALEPNEEIEIQHSTYGKLKFTTYKTEKGTVGIRMALW